MNHRRHFPLILCIAFGICLGELLSALSGTLLKDLILPLIGVIGGTPDFSALHLGPLRIGMLINNSIGIAINFGILWLIWRWLAKRLLKKAAKT